MNAEASDLSGRRSVTKAGRFCLAICVLIATDVASFARPRPAWTYEQLVDRADLVVIVKLVDTKDENVRAPFPPRDGLAASLVCGAVLGLCVSVWLAAASNGDDDDLPLLELLLIVTGISTIICALIGTAASVVASWIEPLRLRVLTVILAGSLAAMVASRLLGHDCFQFPLESVPLLGGTVGAAVGVSLRRGSRPTSTAGDKGDIVDSR